MTTVLRDDHDGEPSRPAYFRALEIDDDPALLHESYRMRYQVYCLERDFLSPHYYPDGVETDVFDQHAVHLGVLNTEDVLVATARLVRRTDDGLPMYGHCSLTVHEPVLAESVEPTDAVPVILGSAVFAGAACAAAPPPPGSASTVASDARAAVAIVQAMVRGRVVRIAVLSSDLTTHD